MSHTRMLVHRLSLRVHADSAKDAQSKVLVHCMSGTTRWVAVLLAFSKHMPRMYLRATSVICAFSGRQRSSAHTSCTCDGGASQRVTNGSRISTALSLSLQVSRLHNSCPRCSVHGLVGTTHPALASTVHLYCAGDQKRLVDFEVKTLGSSSVSSVRGLQMQQALLASAASPPQQHHHHKQPNSLFSWNASSPAAAAQQPPHAINGGTPPPGPAPQFGAPQAPAQSSGFSFSPGASAGGFVFGASPQQ